MQYFINTSIASTVKPDGLWPFACMKQLNKTAYNFSVLLILIPFFIILNFLNKKESKVICMREFETILLQTQSLSIKHRQSNVMVACLRAGEALYSCIIS
jgi:hypothetical protein